MYSSLMGTSGNLLLVKNAVRLFQIKANTITFECIHKDCGQRRYGAIWWYFQK